MVSNLMASAMMRIAAASRHTMLCRARRSLHASAAPSLASPALITHAPPLRGGHPCPTSAMCRRRTTTRTRVLDALGDLVGDSRQDPDDHGVRRRQGARAGGALPHRAPAALLPEGRRMRGRRLGAPIGQAGASTDSLPARSEHTTRLAAF